MHNLQAMTLLQHVAITTGGDIKPRQIKYKSVSLINGIKENFHIAHEISFASSLELHRITVDVTTALFTSSIFLTVAP